MQKKENKLKASLKSILKLYVIWDLQWLTIVILKGFIIFCTILDNAADSKDVEKAELKEVPSQNDDGEAKTETKTAPEEKEDLIKEK